MKTSFKYSLCALAVSSLCYGNIASAQQNDSSADTQQVERIEVTGSRIKRNDLEGASPIQSIGRVEIDRSGFQNLQQILERLPVTGSGTFSTRNNSQDSSANGTAAVSLRGLGPDATLVLINGRRVGISAFAEGITNSFVDLNSIPVSAIERVDILKDGASAIYGSDAVAGVVNVVLKKNFDGTELNASTGRTDNGNYDEHHVSLLWGNSTSSSNSSFILDYFKNSQLGNNEMGRFGTSNQEPYGGLDFRSSRGFPGYFYVNGVKTVDPACPADQLIAAAQVCVYDYGPDSITIPAAERVGAIFQFDKTFQNDVNAFFEFSFQHNTSEAGGAATPLDESAGLTVPGSHPNNPFGQDIEIGRFRPVDGGPRRWDIESNTMRLLAGLKGEINGWDWELAAQKARSQSLQTGGRDQGWVRVDYLQREINNGRYNPFGGVLNPQDVIDDISTSLVRRGESRMTSADFSLSGEAFSFNERTVLMASGVEYRKEQVSDVPDEQFQRGLIFGTEAVSAAADRSQWAAYLEFAVPLTDQIEMQLAGRYDHYSDFGSTLNPKVAFRYTMTDDVTVRASWAQGFRAPSLAQIGLGPSESSIFFVDTYRCQATGEDCGVLDYNVSFSGNPDLDAEETESWNIGVFYASDSGFDIGFDVWSITQDNKIDISYEEAYQAECNNQNSTICRRLPPVAGQALGVLEQLDGSLRNVSSQDVAGIDLSTHYRFDVNEYGSIRLGLEWTYTQKFEKDKRNYLGEYQYPEHRWVASADWSLDNFGASLIFSYIGEFEDTPDIDFDGNLDFDQNTSRTVKAHLLTDLQGYYDVNANLRLTLGINNLLDEDPPFAIGNGDDDLYGYVSKVHNPRGRFIYGKVSYKF